MKNKDKKVKKQKPVEIEETIDKELKAEHLKAIEYLKSLDKSKANYDEEYDKTMKRIKEFEDIMRKKESNENCDKDSKRKNIGSTLITAGATVLTTCAWFGIEKSNCTSGNATKAFISSIFKKK